MVNDEIYYQVRSALTRAQKLFGTEDSAPVEPPSFAPPRDLEQDLGRGAF